ncbi:hypothetical protein PAMP_002169 [Pampus punctatissimus]
MYQTPRMMVPVRTWQHRQQLVENQRSHGEIIILSAVFVKRRARCLSQQRPLSIGAPLMNDKQDPTAADLSVTYHSEQFNGTEAASVRYDIAIDLCMGPCPPFSMLHPMICWMLYINIHILFV